MSPVVQDVSSWMNTTQLDLGIQHSIPCAMEHISTEDFVKELYNWEVLIIVLSNQSISSLYPFMNELLYARFKEIKLD